MKSTSHFGTSPLKALVPVLFLSVFIQACDEDGPIPSITTSEVEDVTATSAVSGGLITSDGGESVIARGVCWSTLPTPTINDSKTLDGPGGGSFTSLLSDLTPSTTYFVRAYATNANGTAYGVAFAFQTGNGQMELTTLPAIEVGCLTAKLGGIVPDVGLPLTAKGLCWSTSPSPTTANNITDEGVSAGEFSSTLHGLACDTKYYVRAYATNSAGTFYGNETSFTTISGSTYLATSIEFIGLNTAVANGSLSAISYPVTVRGFCWSLTHNPTLSGPSVNSGSGVGSFSGNLSELGAGSVYYVRSFATTPEGTIYGNEAEFSTLTPGFEEADPVTDADGNEYSTVVIGTQTWTAENLRANKLNDGTPIGFVTAAADWAAAVSPAYCFYDNNSENNSPYGKLYNYAAVNSGKLCPSGWHAATKADFDVLIALLGGTAEAGGKLKEDGVAHWKSSGGTNQSGFTGLPGSGRAGDGVFNSDIIGYYGLWWAADVSPKLLILDANSPAVELVPNADPKNGFSVRCVKD